MNSSIQVPARAVAVIGLIGAAALAGCSSAGQAGGPATRSISATVSAPASLSAAPTVTPTPVAVTSSGAPPVPVLGQLAGVFASGQGFGQVRPAEVFNGGDPTGLVTAITWQSWGGAQATGTGTGSFDPPNEPVAASKQEKATVVAFNLGTCDGKLMYQAVEWYFPENGQSFSSSHYENICTGSFVPSA